MAFYRSSEQGDKCLIGIRTGNTYEIHDDEDKIAFIKDRAAIATADYVKAVLGHQAWWGEDLNEINGLTDAVTAHMDRMAEVGVKAHLTELPA